MKIFFILFACAIALASCQMSAPKTTGNDLLTNNTYTVPDDSAITKAVHDAYTAISFKEGEQPRYSEIHNYFIPEVQFINFRTDTAQIFTLKQFEDLFKNFLIQTHTHMFYEEEIFGRTEQFGRVAHRISTYVTYLNKRDTATERGVNSFQLIKTKAGWKVSSIIWDVEKPTLKVPGYYLKK